MIRSDFLREVRSGVRLVVGQVASPLPEGEDYAGYDLVISWLPNPVEDLRAEGAKAELHRFAFEPDVLRRVGNRRGTSISFVGSISPYHESRLRMLEYLCRTTPLEIWGHGVEALSADSPIRARFKGHAWGIEMYRVLARSRITRNRHLDLAGPYANDMRLFEATESGPLLVTDSKVNLSELFTPGSEVVAYTSPDEIRRRHSPLPQP